MGTGARGSVPTPSAGSLVLPSAPPTDLYSICPRNLSGPRAPAGWWGGGSPGLSLALWPNGLSPSAGARWPGCSQVPAGAPSCSSAHLGAGGPVWTSSARRGTSSGRHRTPWGRAHKGSGRASLDPAPESERSHGQCGPPGGNNATGQNGVLSSCLGF